MRPVGYGPLGLRDHQIQTTTLGGREMTKTTATALKLAEFSQGTDDGEQGEHNVIFSRFTTEGLILSKKAAIALSGLKYNGTQNMGEIYTSEPTAKHVDNLVIVNQYFSANC
jgi:hypothetical protein